MQASYQDHVSETQQLQGKVSPTLCSAASSSGCWVAFGGTCVVFWRRLRCARGPEPRGGARPHDAPGLWCLCMWEHPHGMSHPSGLSASVDTLLCFQSLLLIEWASQGE